MALEDAHVFLQKLRFNKGTYPPWNWQFAPENGWLEYYFPIGFRAIFRCELLVSGRVISGLSTPPVTLWTQPIDPKDLNDWPHLWFGFWKWSSSTSWFAACNQKCHQEFFLGVEGKSTQKKSQYTGKWGHLPHHHPTKNPWEVSREVPSKVLQQREENGGSLCGQESHRGVLAFRNDLIPWHLGESNGPKGG